MKINGIVTTSIAKIGGIASASVAKIDGIVTGPPPTGFKTEWVVAGDATARTITLPLYNTGTFNCTVSWGDGTSDSTVTTYDDADRAHTYAADGTYEVEITGECPGWSFNNTGDKLKITDIINWGHSSLFGGFSYLTAGFYGCTNLKSTGVGKIVSKNTLTSLSQLFRSCTGNTSITAGMFDNCTYLTSSGFHYVFYQNSITSIPADLFKYNVSVSTTGFAGTFRACGSLTTIPTDLFKYNVALTSSAFSSTFYDCTSLTTLPTDLFRYNTEVTSSAFESTFRACALTSLPSDIFRYNTKASTDSFKGAFINCTALATVPENLFKYNVSALSFWSAFYNCNKLQQVSTMFYAAGEQSTRFLNQSVDFSNCFNRSSFTGTQGDAPDLWNCDFGTGTPVKTDCWEGAGNSTTSLSNYASIPAAWI